MLSLLLLLLLEQAMVSAFRIFILNTEPAVREFQTTFNKRSQVELLRK